MATDGLFTVDDLRRLEQAVYLAPGGNGDLLDKIREVIENEYRTHGPRQDFALTPAQLVKQMILDSPLARVPDVAQPIDVVNVAIQLKYLKRLIEAVEAL